MKKLSLVIGVIALLAVTVTATSWGGNTPLYTVRMEQASSKMHFLPAIMNTVVYTAEQGYTLTCAVTGGTIPFKPETTDTCEGWTCEYTCVGSTCASTCPYTCPNTCQSTCPNTCQNTCPNTCYNTCEETCEVCVTISTCVTCGGRTCDPPCG